MRVLSHQLGHGASLSLCSKSLLVAGKAALVVVYGGGRGCVLRNKGPMAGMWIPLRGRLQIGADTMVHSGELRVTEPEQNLRAVGRGDALWVAVLGTPPAWRQAMAGISELTVEPSLLPAGHVADRDLRTQTVELARAVLSGTAENSVEPVLDRVMAQQDEFQTAIARCPGRTYAQRRQVFLRLQRVRNYLAVNCHLDIDNDALARMANYSPWHFIRAFRAAFEETPHAFLVQQRLERARHLLHASPLAIAEIALASGFENRCAFSRLFRSHYGTTAAAMRRAGRGGGMAGAVFAN